MLFGAYRFLSVAVENLLHQLSVSVTAGQQTRRGGHEKAREDWRKKDKEWGETAGKKKEEDGQRRKGGKGEVRDEQQQKNTGEEPLSPPFVQTSITIDHCLPIIAQVITQERRTREDTEKQKWRRKQQQSGKPSSPSYSPSPRSCTSPNSSFPHRALEASIHRLFSREKCFLCREQQAESLVVGTISLSLAR
jgi:hypothetical protein